MGGRGGRPRGRPRPRPGSPRPPALLTAETGPPPDVERLVARVAGALRATGLPFMLVGGQALLVHGEPRLTRDVDVTLAADPSALDAVLGAAAAAGLRPLPGDPAAFARETFVLPCLDPPTKFRVDFIFSSTPYEVEAIGRAGPVRYADIDVPVATPEDLVLHKVFAGRPRDIEDARSVARRRALDRAYLGRWAAAFAAIPGREGIARTLADILGESRAPRVEAAGRTDIGCVRKANEDSYAIAPAGAEPWWAVVCDGLGGHAAGEVASAMAVETFAGDLAGLAAGTDHAGRLDGLARAANDRILRAAAADPARKGMGTTVVALVIDGDRAVVAHAGDSRAYRLRAGSLERLTDDHTVARELVRRGIVAEAEAPRVRGGNELARVIGMEGFDGIESRALDAAPGDVWLLASDGLTNAVGEAEIAQKVAAPPAEAADRLVEAARAAGGPDNITVVVARIVS